MKKRRPFVLCAAMCMVACAAAAADREPTYPYSKYEHDRPSLIIRDGRVRYGQAQLGTTLPQPIPGYLEQNRPPKYTRGLPSRVIKRHYGMPEATAESLADPQLEFMAESHMIDVMLRRGRMMVSTQPIVRAALSNNEIAEVVRLGDNRLSIAGLKHGSTTLTVWVADHDEPYSYVLRVGHAGGARSWALGSWGKLEEVE